MGVLILGALPIFAFFAMFCVLYSLGYLVVFRSWSPKQRSDASSCFISLFHGPPAVFLAISALIAQPIQGFATPNNEFHSFVLDFSIAYFVVDLLHYLILVPKEILYIAHHLATLFVFVTCRYLVHHGASALLVLLVLAEVTSACQNVWTISGLRKTELPTAAKVHRLLSLPFYVLYTLMRGLLGPIFFCKMSAFYLSGKANDAIPRWVSLSWIVVVGAAILISILWISKRWVGWYRERSQNGEKKNR